MTDIPIKTKRELRRMDLAELTDYHFLLLNIGGRSSAQQATLEHTAKLMLQKQAALQDLGTAAPRPAQPGYVYLVESNNTYKIGRSANVPKRLRVFGIQLPYPTRLVHTIATTDMVWAEAQLHQRFTHCRLGGEWFALSPDEIAQICALAELNP